MNLEAGELGKNTAHPSSQVEKTRVGGSLCSLLSHRHRYTFTGKRAPPLLRHCLSAQVVQEPTTDGVEP